MKSKIFLLVSLTVIIFVVLYFATFRQSSQSGNQEQMAVELEKSLGQEIVLRGQAVDAKMGAVILVGDTPVYIENLQSWPESLGGTEVFVSGKLVFKPYLPEAEKRNGEISQGGSGEESYVLQDVQIK